MALNCYLTITSTFIRFFLAFLNLVRYKDNQFSVFLSSLKNFSILIRWLDPPFRNFLNINFRQILLITILVRYVAPNFNYFGFMKIKRNNSSC